MSRSPEDAAVRAFFAVDLDEAARSEADRVARRLRDAPRGDAVRWVQAENYHVTLRFLGNVASGRLAPLAEQARRAVCDVAPFSLRLGALQAFPSPRRPRVIVLELEPSEPLAALAAAVERAVVACGLPAETRRFRSHLTLGRVRERGFLPPLGAPAPVPFPVDNFVLFRSQLSRSGPTYTAVERIPLGGSP